MYLVVSKSSTFVRTRSSLSLKKTANYNIKRFYKEIKLMKNKISIGEYIKLFQIVLTEQVN